MSGQLILIQLEVQGADAKSAELKGAEQPGPFQKANSKSGLRKSPLY